MEKNNIAADLVVYGKIYTSENNQIVDAFAVKDGKYIYVGDKKGAESFVKDGTTEIIDHSGKGLVMPGCGNGHAHYSAAHCISKVGITVDFDDTPEKFLNEIVPAAVKKARENGMISIFGSGWRLLTFEKNMPTRQQLDAIFFLLIWRKKICKTSSNNYCLKVTRCIWTALEIIFSTKISTKRLKNTTKKEKCILFLARRTNLKVGWILKKI